MEVKDWAQAVEEKFPNGIHVFPPGEDSDYPTKTKGVEPNLDGFLLSLWVSAYKDITLTVHTIEEANGGWRAYTDQGTYFFRPNEEKYWKGLFS